MKKIGSANNIRQLISQNPTNTWLVQVVWYLFLLIKQNLGFESCRLKNSAQRVLPYNKPILFETN